MTLVVEQQLCVDKIRVGVLVVHLAALAVVTGGLALVLVGIIGHGKLAAVAVAAHYVYAYHTLEREVMAQAEVGRYVGGEVVLTAFVGATRFKAS